MTKPQKTIGRNDPCHCNSGKKYKKCCMHADDETARLKRRIEPEEEEEEWNFEIDDDDDSIGNEAVKHDTTRCDAPLREYPKPASIPKATPEIQDVVDRWWNAFMPAYEKRDLDTMNGMMDTFFAQHPDIVPHLGLHEECLLDWAPAMCEGNRHEELIERLFRMRSDFPLMYDQIFQYLDLWLAEALIVAGRKREISGILDRHIAYPDADCDYLEKFLDVLLLANLQDEVFIVARATAIPCACSSNVMGYGPALKWLYMEAAIPIIEQRDNSSEAASALIKAYDNLELPFDHEAGQDSAESWLTDIFIRPDMKIFAIGKKHQKNDAIRGLCSNVMVWLHDSQRLSWASAAYFSNMLIKYYTEIARQGALPADPLLLDQRHVEGYIHSLYRDAFELNGTRAFSLLQAFCFLADFMQAIDHCSKTSRTHMADLCRDVKTSVSEELESLDAAIRFFDSFPTYKFAAD